MRKSKRHWWIGTGLLVFAAAMAAAGEAEAPQESKADRTPEPELILRSYRVADLMYSVRDYRGFMRQVEHGSQTADLSTSGAVGDLFDSGAQAIVDDSSGPEQVSCLVQRYVSEATDPKVAPWADEGGSAEIDFFRGALLITQTPAAHEQIEALFTELRAGAGLIRTVVVDVQWIRVTNEGADAILEGLAADPAAPQRVSDDLLDRAGAEVVYRGRISGMDGQTVYIESCSTLSYKADVEAVVGEGGAAFEPVIGSMPTVLAMQVMPVVESNGRSVLLDIFTQMCEATFRQDVIRRPEEPAVTAEIETPSAKTRELRTTVHMPLDTNILIGGMNTPNEPASQTLYLVLRVSVSK